MKRVGEVVGVAQRLAVVRSPDDETPSLGATVVTERLDDVGTVVDIFGPVERPYLAVTPDAGPEAGLVGEVLYSRAGTGN